MKRSFRPSPILALACAAVMQFSPGVLAANTATEPVPRDPKWVARHEGFVAEAKAGGIDVLFLGDSITDAWRSKGRAVWDAKFTPLKAANFGISGDRTQHVLWRLRNGEAEGYQPRAVVLMIGTNNTGKERDSEQMRNTNAEIVEGVTAVVNELRAKFPKTKILFLAIFPRGEKDSPQRRQVADVNAELKKLHDGKTVHWLDIGGKFLAPDGSIPLDIMPDLLHPNEKGYQIWADAIEQPLKKLVK
jgi:lysophospholipase L1-like esterase